MTFTREGVIFEKFISMKRENFQINLIDSKLCLFNMRFKIELNS